MTRQTTQAFLEDLGVYTTENLKRFNNGRTITELKNGFQFEIMRKEFYSDTGKYNEFMNHLNKYQ